MSDQLERESRSRWPSIRLSVRGMMLAVLILGGGLGWSVHRAHVQRDAVAAIKRGGGLVEFDWQYLNGKYLRNATPPGPRWLATAIGPDFLGHPYRVVIGPGDAKRVMTQIGQFRRIRTLTLGRDPSISDADMVHLKGMADLESLFFDKGKITGAGLENFAGLPKLHTLSLQGIPLTDGDLRPLEALTNPDALTLDSPRITDVGLVHLKQLVPLRFISLNETGVTGAGLGNLADMSNLEILYLVKTNVSSLQSIQHLPKLRWLDLTDTPLDDAGVAALADPGSFPSLAIFQASNTRLTDNGLRSLRGRSNLERIFLDGTRITDSGLIALGKMPTISILGVGRTSFTDAGLAHLSQFVPKLTRLDVSQTAVTDAGLAHLARSHGLVSLNLSQTAVTDAGLKSLTGLKRLRFLKVGKTRVTEAGVDALREAIPKLKITQ